METPDSSGKLAPDRRRWLQGASTATFSAFWGFNAAKADERTSDAPGAVVAGDIDAHSHIWTRDLARYPLSGGAQLGDLDPASFTTEELLALLSQNSVSRAVLIQHHKFYGFDNRYMTDAYAQHPEHFRVVGMVDDLSSSPDQAMRGLLKQGVTGFRITSWIRGRQWLRGPGMASMWRCAADTGQAICCLMDPPYLGSLDSMCRQHPETKVVVDHFARIGVDGIIRQRDITRLCRLARHRNTHVKLSAFYALGKKKPPYLDLVPMIRQLLDAFGPHRLMWASDSPYQLLDGHTYASSHELVRDHLDFLSAADRRLLLRDTAERVYWI
ncbi:MAG: amidohydrolase family protein [Pirellulaceae bacterium]|jgi:predicted TIM-barrel fold metal-dependent hydrolase|nr:amidohydrolase family protein [Pirellulaceae bacterium]